MPPADMQRIVVYTTHKAGSMFLYNFSVLACGLAGLPLYSPNKPPGSALCTADIGEIREPGFILNPQGNRGCYCPIRAWCARHDPESWDIVLHVRDLRDVMTSMYYSWAYSHEGIDEERRETWQKQGIDRFVLERYDLPLEIYRSYLENLHGHQGVVFLRYEEMVTDFPSWARKFLEPFRFDNADAARDRIIISLRGEFDVEGEDVMRHKRKITPGDYLDKLQPETIRVLNRECGDVLSAFGYEI